MLTTPPALDVQDSVSGLVRPFARGDVPEVAQLYNRAFRKSSARPSAELEAFFVDLFFDAPCQADTPLSSYVFEDAQGRIGGFVGTHPRTLMLEGRRVAAAAYGQLMVAPELRGRGMAFKLVEQFYQGGQEYSFCGSAAPATRAINERLGGINPAAKGLRWRKLLRPGRALARRLARARKLGPLRHLAGAWTGRLRLEASMAHGEMPDLGAIESVYEQAFTAEQFHPIFQPDHVAWKLRRAAVSNKRTMFARVVDVGSGPIGWYVWFLAADGTATVVEMLCVASQHETVLRHLLRQARAAGAESIGGLCNHPSDAQAARSVGASVRRAESSFVFHAPNHDLLKDFPGGPQYLSQFDGEGWLDFP